LSPLSPLSGQVKPFRCWWTSKQCIKKLSRGIK
jgi:hypothetical protein